MSRGHAPQAATLSGRRARCGKQRPAPRRVVLIDVDSAADSDVYIIGDDGEFHRASTFCAGKGNSLCSNVINIDDDDEEEGGRAGPSSAGNGRYLEATMPQHGFPRNRCGLDYISDSFESDKSEEGSDGDNGSDCEILDDTLGTVRKLWEKAASRKRMPGGLHARKDSRASTSTSSAESRTQPLENMENVFNTECHLSDTIWEYFKDVPREGTPNSSCGAKDGSCSVPNACKRLKDDVSSGKETEDSNATSNLDPTMDHNNETAPCQEGMIPQKTPEGSQSPEFNEYTFKGSYFCQPTGQEDTGARFKMSAPVFEENVACESLKTEAGMSSSFICTRKALPGYSWADRKGEGPPVAASFFEKMDDKIPEGKHCQMDQTTQNAHDRIGKQHKEMCFPPGDPLVSSQGTDEPHCNSRCCCLKQYEENCPHVQVKSCSMNAVTDEDASVNVKSMNKPLSPKDLVHSPEKLGQSTIDQDGQDFENDLIGAREKHKEPYEYKRAAEEEWASRQRQLQIQAEEAQRMRRRRKAETLRLLDMERRQKQRLEEVRESQRKNEEDIHLKEQLRVVVRKELDNMEKRYSDMASLLQGLGIPVEGGEVKAAYKQALLKFHPDRVSRSDIHQQVKAEETFKFISRLKEKLLPVA